MIVCGVKIDIDVFFIKEIDFQVGVVLPAAGSGERLKNFIPKQYFEIQVCNLTLCMIDLFLKM
jgi:2-C-methyl-D-erythritol 4-phosphate cytidylyltransferase